RDIIVVDRREPRGQRRVVELIVETRPRITGEVVGAQQVLNPVLRDHVDAERILVATVRTGGVGLNQSVDPIGLQEVVEVQRRYIARGVTGQTERIALQRTLGAAWEVVRALHVLAVLPWDKGVLTAIGPGEPQVRLLGTEVETGPAGHPDR